MEAYMRGTTTNVLGFYIDSRWMTGDNSVLWMEQFMSHVKPSAEDKVILLDNHKSHLQPRAHNIAKENGVVMVNFPPHTTHRLQPLDVSVYAPFQPTMLLAMSGRFLTLARP